LGGIGGKLRRPKRDAGVDTPMAHASPEELTDAVYRAALEPAAWDDVMRLLSDRFPSAAQTFYILHLEPRRVQPVSLVGIGPRWLRCFDEHYFARDNPWIKLTQRLHRPGLVRTNERLERFLRDPGVLYRSSYYNDWMRPQGFKYTIGNTLLSEDGIVANITLLRAPDMKTFSGAEVLAFELLSKHMTRALQMGIRLERPENCPASTATLDAMPQAIVVLDAQRRVLYANAAAESVLARKRGLMVRQGELRATDEGDQQRLATCVADALSAGGPAARGNAALVLRLGESGHLRLHALPLAGSLGRALISRPTVLLMITEHVRLAPASHAVICQLYGCTSSEARLARLLAEGHTLQESATRMGITYGTARAYMKVVFEKVGVHTQAQLVARVLGDVGGSMLRRRKSDV
jgi:DNA-binding CsgD family transcriptional regulator/PAS domain-containing protein